MNPRFDQKRSFFAGSVELSQKCIPQACCEYSFPMGFQVEIVLFYLIAVEVPHKPTVRQKVFFRHPRKPTRIRSPQNQREAPPIFPSLLFLFFSLQPTRKTDILQIHSGFLFQWR
jgi:hypothetical protein